MSLKMKLDKVFYFFNLPLVLLIIIGIILFISDYILIGACFIIAGIMYMGIFLFLDIPWSFKTKICVQVFKYFIFARSQDLSDIKYGDKKAKMSFGFYTSLKFIISTLCFLLSFFLTKIML